MATSSMINADPSQIPASGDGSDGSGGASEDYTIQIIVSGGQISVGVMPGDGDSDDSSADSGASGGADGSSASSGGGDPDNDGDSDSGASGAQPVKNIKEALTIALDIYRNGGQVQDADSDFNSGFQGQTKTPAPPTGGDNS